MSNNRNSYKLLLTACLIAGLFISQAWASVYKCEDDYGNIIFSDEPCKKGQSGTRLRWLKNTHSGLKSRKNKVLTQEQKTARKAKKNNKAYVLLSLLTTTKLELETRTLRSYLNGEASDHPELMLPDGIVVDLLDVDKMLINYKLGADELKVHFIMHDGYEETRIIKKPFPVLSGEARLGSFSKSLEDIKQIEFFNSQKLRKKRDRSQKQKKLAEKNKQKSLGDKPARKQAAKNKEEVPVIELDLSNEVTPSKNEPVKEFTNIPGADTVTMNSVKKLATANTIETLSVSKPKAKPRIKVVPKNAPVADIPKPVIHSVEGKRLPMVFANGKTTFLKRGTLSSRKGDKAAPPGLFILNSKEQIPYTQIKSIRVRPTADKSRLVVAVALKSGEIKMENMSRPFTRIHGRSDKGEFEHSLLDIKSINF